MDKKLGRGLDNSKVDALRDIMPEAVPETPEPDVPQQPSAPPRLGRGIEDIVSAIQEQAIPVHAPPERHPEPSVRDAILPLLAGQSYDTPVGRSAGLPLPQPPQINSQPAPAPYAGPAVVRMDAGEQSGSVTIELNRIVPNRFQPRKVFDTKSLEELAQSIKSSGIIQPVIVRLLADGRYEIVAGERRWRASALLGLTTIPAIVKGNIDDRQMLEWALVENIQRKDLNPIERARAYRDLVREFNLTQEEVAKRVGLERSTVTNFLRLLELPLPVQDEIAGGTLSPTHAIPLLTLDSPELQIKIAQRVKKKGMTVRRLNYIINWIKRRRAQQTTSNITPASGRAQMVLKEIEDRLRAKLGCKATITSPDQKRGKVILEFYSPEGFQRIIDALEK